MISLKSISLLIFCYFISLYVSSEDILIGNHEFKTFPLLLILSMISFSIFCAIYVVLYHLITAMAAITKKFEIIDHKAFKLISFVSIFVPEPVGILILFIYSLIWCSIGFKTHNADSSFRIGTLIFQLYMMAFKTPIILEYYRCVQNGIHYTMKNNIPSMLLRWAFTISAYEKFQAQNFFIFKCFGTFFALLALSRGMKHTYLAHEAGIFFMLLCVLLKMAYWGSKGGKNK